MKYKLKKIMLVGLSISIAATLFGCSLTSNKQEKPTASESTIKEDKTVTIVEPMKEVQYNADVAKYFPKENGIEFLYNGTAEYEQHLAVKSIVDETKKLILSMEGNVVDANNEGQKFNNKLAYEYIIDDIKVTEVIKNEKPSFAQSIIKELVVLRSDIKPGHSWDQDVTVGDKTYNANTEITRVGKDDEGLEMIYTTVTIENIEGYPENTYKEYRVYKEGKGIYRYDRLMNYEGADGFEFGYTLYEGL